MKQKMDLNILAKTNFVGERGGIKCVILKCGKPFNCLYTKVFIFAADSAKQDREAAF
jgi:hypothetical protein